MLFAYVDESYIVGKVHLIGALVVDSQQADRIGIELDQVLWKTNKAHPEVSLDLELHGQNLFQRSKEWSCLQPKPKVAFSIYRNALHRISMVKPKWFIGGVARIDRLSQRYVDPWPPHQIALQYALEQVDEYATSMGKKVTIIADQVPDQAHHEARMKHFQDSGQTPGWKRRSLESIVHPYQWVDSREHRSLQAADLLTYVYLRKRYKAHDAHTRTVAEVQKLRDVAMPCLHGQHVWTP